MNEGRSRFCDTADLIATFFTDIVSDCGVPGLAGDGDGSPRSNDCVRTLLFFLDRAALIPDSLAGLAGALFAGTVVSLISTLVDRWGLDSEPSPIIASSPCSGATGDLPLVFGPESLDQKAHVEPADG